jgi:hypothetical protein
MKDELFVLLVALITIGAFPFFCAADISTEMPDMKDIINVLKEHRITYYLFTNEQGNQFLVVPKFGSRILAVSVAGENHFWTHPHILNGQGGQRTWINPEGGAKKFYKAPLDVLKSIGKELICPKFDQAYLFEE